jgi:hypothetical protein
MGRKVMPRPVCHIIEIAPVTGGGGASGIRRKCPPELGSGIDGFSIYTHHARS